MTCERIQTKLENTLKALPEHSEEARIVAGHVEKLQGSCPSTLRRERRDAIIPFTVSKAENTQWIRNMGDASVVLHSLQ